MSRVTAEDSRRVSLKVVRADQERPPGTCVSRDMWRDRAERAPRGQRPDSAPRSTGIRLRMDGRRHKRTLAASEVTRAVARARLMCRFIRGDAFEPAVAIDDGAGSIVISSGLMHHRPASGLAEFFAAQARLRVAAFVHWDIAPCLWSTIGAWVFHQARMREPVSRHDGVLSARRAHPAAVLQAAAPAGAPAYDVRVLEGPRWHPRALDVRTRSPEPAYDGRGCCRIARAGAAVDDNEAGQRL
jgi:hypothetical protein